MIRILLVLLALCPVTHCVAALPGFFRSGPMTNGYSDTSAPVWTDFTNGIIAYYRFDTTNASDQFEDSISGIHQFNHGATQSGAGVGKLYSTCAIFNGTNAWTSRTNALLNWTNNQPGFAVGGWINVTGPKSDYHGAVVSRESGNTTAFQIAWLTDGYWEGGIGSGGSLDDVFSLGYSASVSGGTETNVWLFQMESLDITNDKLWLYSGNSTAFFATNITWASNPLVGTSPVEFGSVTGGTEGHFGFLQGNLNGWGMWATFWSSNTAWSYWNNGQGVAKP